MIKKLPDRATHKARPVRQLGHFSKGLKFYLIDPLGYLVCNFHLLKLCSMDEPIYYPDPLDPLSFHQPKRRPEPRRTATTGNWLPAIFKVLLEVLAYAPLIFTGYLISRIFLDRKDSAFSWIGFSLLFAFLLYQLVFFFKGILIGLKAKANILWLPLFLLCAGFTCLLPAYLAYEPVNYIVLRLKGSSFMTWFLLVLFGLYVFSRYNFLSDSSPKLAQAAYRAGQNIIL